jgi:hypothetical protein
MLTLSFSSKPNLRQHKRKPVNVNGSGNDVRTVIMDDRLSGYGLFDFSWGTHVRSHVRDMNKCLKDGNELVMSSTLRHSNMVVTQQCKIVDGHGKVFFLKQLTNGRVDKLC